MNNRVNQLLPTLKIHSWGGFGSQLFTCYLVLKLKEQYPGRRFKVIVHTSGVTRRSSEIDFESQRIDYSIVDDYSNSNSRFVNLPSKSASNFLVNSLKSILRKLVISAKFVLYSNNDESFMEIKPWTLALRGHYTNLTLKSHLVEQLYRLLFGTNMSEPIPYSVIHYRLGDLLDLESKSPVSTQRIDKLIEELSLTPQKVILLTDSSSEEYYSFVEDSKFLTQFKPFNQNPLKTLESCIQSDVFIGTGAKIVLWAAIFRKYIFQRNSYLPVELRWCQQNGLDSIWY